MVKDMLKDIVWPTLISVMLFVLLPNLHTTNLSKQQTKDGPKSNQSMLPHKNTEQNRT